MQIPLADNEVHVWWTLTEAMNDPALLDRYDAVLSSSEKQRQRRFIFEKDRKQYLVAHALVRRVLSSYAPVDPAAWHFAEGEYGKPSIAEPFKFSDLRFNLSHTNGAAVVAVARGLEIGIDIENTSRKGNWDDISTRFFAPQETAYLRSLDEPHKTSAFFDIWTLKESYIKARGKGISIPLDRFFFTLPASGQSPVGFHASPCDEHPEKWQFHQFTPAPGYRIALAVPVSAQVSCSVTCRETSK